MKTAAPRARQNMICELMLVKDNSSIGIRILFMLLEISGSTVASQGILLSLSLSLSLSLFLAIQSS